MRLDDWFIFYSKILSDFGFSREEDERAAKLMHELAAGKLLDAEVLRRVIEGKRVAVIGYAIDAEEFRRIREEVKITAGKAILKILEYDPDFVPDIHVTDMEEDDVVVELDKRGSLLVLHAHGDNIDRINSIVPRVSKFVGTTQSTPFNRIYNFGGFTDGDRAAILVKEMGAEVVLYGFDFEKASGIKKRKLEWAKKILEFEGIL